MANIIGNLFGGAKSVAKPVPSAEPDDFADFAEAPDPSPSPIQPVAKPVPGGASLAGAPAITGRPYTKWYNVHERYTWNDFRGEGIILAAAVVMLALHLFGSRLNRSKARKWARATAPILSSEFAVVGFGGAPTPEDANPDTILKETSLFEFSSYATGRQNIAFVDIKLTLTKRFNPLMTFAEGALSFFMDSFTTQTDTMTASLYPFDGREAATVPGLPGAAEVRAKDAKSSYDGFVWAVVNKDKMKELRDDRYDLSITFTKDNAKLPSVLSIMSENAEITDALLTPELVEACEAAGDLLEYLIITDQPQDKPKTLDETQPRKRLYLRHALPADNDYAPLLPLFAYFLRLPDQLASSAHFRPEVLRKIRGVREEAAAQIRKADEAERAEERAQEREKAKKEKRDKELAALDAKAQKKYLEREREKELRKTQKKQTVRG